MLDIHYKCTSRKMANFQISTRTTKARRSQLFPLTTVKRHEGWSARSERRKIWWQIS
ncbi:hypothetical protein OESDEN_23824 [Oesophagostomum dentatum]|uniref:Uncharacterized protein n=1 Tax=Oesophagostomum dentatum TaxID=61180 RepID=A0A0B1RY46_OESDE|nr:hypothetical protein OESDEN_23824 [Oesophagostomum dentatum]